MSGTLDDVLDPLACRMLQRSGTWFPHVHRSRESLLTHLGMGVAGEGGEVCDEVKKLMRSEDGWVGPYDKLHGEIADAFTYLIMLAWETGMDWTKTLDAMVAKCEARWGEVPA